MMMVMLMVVMMIMVMSRSFDECDAFDDDDDNEMYVIKMMRMIIKTLYDFNSDDVMLITHQLLCQYL